MSLSTQCFVCSLPCGLRSGRLPVSLASLVSRDNVGGGNVRSATPRRFFVAFGRFGCILTFFCKSSMAILLLRFAGFQIPVGRCLFLHRGAQLLYSTARMELGSASMCQVLRTLQPGSSHQEIVAPAYVVRMALRTSIRTVSCKIPSEICVWCRVAKNSPPSFETLDGIGAFCEHASWITGTCT